MIFLWSATDWKVGVITKAYLVVVVGLVIQAIVVGIVMVVSFSARHVLSRRTVSIFYIGSRLGVIFF